MRALARVGLRRIRVSACSARPASGSGRRGLLRCGRRRARLHARASPTRPAPAPARLCALRAAQLAAQAAAVWPASALLTGSGVSHTTGAGPRVRELGGPGQGCRLPRCGRRLARPHARAGPRMRMRMVCGARPAAGSPGAPGRRLCRQSRALRSTQLMRAPVSPACLGVSSSRMTGEPGRPVLETSQTPGLPTGLCCHVQATRKVCGTMLQVEAVLRARDAGVCGARRAAPAQAAARPT